MTKIERHHNPVMSHSAEQVGEHGGMVVRFHNPDTLETVAEFCYDHVERLEGVACGMRKSSAIMVSLVNSGYEATVRDHGLVPAMVLEGLSDVDLTVDDILGAKEGPGDIVDGPAR